MRVKKGISLSVCPKKKRTVFKSGEKGKNAENKWFFFTKRSVLSIILAENCSREKDF
jgi:hypothetical protein